MVTLTVTEALAIQARQVAHYGAANPDLDVARIVADKTDLTGLELNAEYRASDLANKVPRGAWIEWAIADARAAAGVQS